MTPLLIVAGSALILGAGTPLALRRLHALDRWPTLSAWLWLATSLGAVAAVALTGLLLLMPTGRVGTSAAELLRTCVMMLRAALSTPHENRGETLAGVVALVAVAGGWLVGGCLVGRRTSRAARDHRELLALAGQPTADQPGVTMLEHGRPFAYCLPGRPGPVVISSTALARLQPGQLAAVLAHERAHQIGRHHWMVLLAQVLRVGFPWLPVARLAPHQVHRLVELAADDAAARIQGRRQVAAALAALGDSTIPTVALGAAGTTANERVSRLLAPRQQGGVLTLVTVLLLIGVPITAISVAVVLPMTRVAGVLACPLG